MSTRGGDGVSHRAGAALPGGVECVCWPDRGVSGHQVVHQRLPAVPQTVRTLRRRMQQWVRDLSVDVELAESIVLIVDEAVTNAVEHACPDWECTVELIAAPRACGGGVAVLVEDNGAWEPVSDPGFRGRGVTLMGLLSERSSIRADHRGTAVRMCWSTPDSSAHPTS